MAVPSSTSTTETHQVLRDVVARGGTGCLSVGAGAAEIAVYLLDGHVIATRASDDTAALIDRLEQASGLSAERARQLRQMQEMSMPVLGQHRQDPIIGLLFDEHETDALDRVLADRFEENVARFVANPAAPRWEDGVVPWVFNVQIGHDTTTLLDQATAVAELAGQLHDEDLVQRGSAAPSTAQDGQVAAAVEDGPASVAAVLQRLALPPIIARALVAHALAEGLLTRAREQAEDAEEVDEEMEAFSGVEDTVRGGSRGGSFVTDRRNLDRVEIDVVDDVVPSSNRDATYSAPTLTEEDAREKVAVANEVLTALVAAFDDVQGQRRGRAVVQLLVDGRPRAFVPLFVDVQVTAKGLLPDTAILANLRRRPDSEQRHLLNQGMLDLLDRALDRAADELPDEVVDDVLGRVMGYRQRLGL